MIQIQQFRFSSDNLGYVLHSEGQAVSVDGGAVEAVVEYVHRHKLVLTHALYTHEHPDHTAGRAQLLQATGAEHLTCDELARRAQVMVGQVTLQVLSTPGHTLDSLCFYTGDSLLTGDTLFNGTVGNCFSGDLRAFYDSITHLMDFPAATLIYAGHDYLTYAMQFARLVEPDNPHIEAYLARYRPDRVVTTLADERKVNPYLRFNTPELISVLRQRQLPVNGAYERWESVMQLG